MPDDKPPSKQWYEIPDLARYLELDERLIREYVHDGLLPSPVKLSKKKAAYHRDELSMIVWIIAHKERFRRGEMSPKPTTEK